MTEWRPLSRRGQPDQRLDEPTEGLPPYLAGPILDWLRGAFADGMHGGIPDGPLTLLQLKFKLEPALDWRQGAPSALHDLLQRVAEDEEFGLDIIDFVLHHVSRFTDEYERPEDVAGRLASVLHLGGSAWEVTQLEYDEYSLSRRAVGPIREALESMPASGRAHQHLVKAWNQLAGRNPDESGAYRESVKAVEAAAKPVVLPENDRATLGQMIAALRDAPDKWTVTIGAVADVQRSMEIVWKSQLDRHGTDDGSVPFSVSPAEADAAFSICLNLSRLFAGGHIQQVSAQKAP